MALTESSIGAAADAAPQVQAVLDALGVAVYTTDASGRITFFNEAAETLWGRRPEVGEEWCGSWRLYWPDGRPMPHRECPMAVALLEDRLTQVSSRSRSRRGRRRSGVGRAAAR